MKIKKLTVPMNEELLTDFKVICIKNGLTMTEVIIKFVEEFKNTYSKE